MAGNLLPQRERHRPLITSPHMLKPFAQSPMQCLLFPLRKQSKPKVYAMTQDSVGSETPGIVGREPSLVCGRLAASGILQPGSLHFWVVHLSRAVYPASPAFSKPLLNKFQRDAARTPQSALLRFFKNHSTSIVWRVFSISAIPFAERWWQPWRDAFVNMRNSLLAKAKTIPFPYLRQQLN